MPLPTPEEVAAARAAMARPRGTLVTITPEIGAVTCVNMGHPIAVGYQAWRTYSNHPTDPGALAQPGEAEPRYECKLHADARIAQYSRPLQPQSDAFEPCARCGVKWRDHDGSYHPFVHQGHAATAIAHEASEPCAQCGVTRAEHAGVEQRGGPGTHQFKPQVTPTPQANPLDGQCLAWHPMLDVTCRVDLHGPLGDGNGGHIGDHVAWPEQQAEGDAPWVVRWQNIRLDGLAPAAWRKLHYRA